MSEIKHVKTFSEGAGEVQVVPTVAKVAEKIEEIIKVINHLLDNDRVGA